jgi:(p)ppGpp synthase/HD superfamily hydrolase
MSFPETELTTIRRALRYAESKHRGEIRKGTEDIPYFVHPTAVALLLAATGAPVYVIVAGILHDTVEDTDATTEEIRQEFGSKVAELVDEMTKPGGKLPAKETAARLTSFDSLSVKAADLCVNLNDLLDDAEAHGVAYVATLFRDPVAKIDSYLELSVLLEDRLWAARSGSDYGVVLADRLRLIEPRVRKLRDLIVPTVV